MVMRRILLWAIVILTILLIKEQPLQAQDLDLSSSTFNIQGLGNQGLTAAALSTGYLNTAINDARGLQANSLSTFNTRDVAVGDLNDDNIQDIIAITADDTNGDGIADRGNLILFPGVNNGTFKLPQIFQTTGIPVALAVADLDMDGMLDAVVAEQGFVEIFTGFFIVTSRITSLDRIGNPNANPPGNALITIAGNRVLAIALGNLDNDSVNDIVIAEQGAGAGTVELFFTAANSGSHKSAEKALNTKGSIGSNSLAISALRVLAVQQSNLKISDSTTVDTDLDLFVATSAGIEIFERNSDGFMAPTVIAAGSNPAGLLVVDINADAKADLIVLNRESGTISTFLALTSDNYDKPLTDRVGQNPISLAIINFNNDGRTDILVINAPPGGNVAGDISVLTNIGRGLFNPAISLNRNRNLPLFNPQAVVAGRLETAFTADDIIVADGLASTSPGGVLYLSSRKSYNLVPLQVFSAISPMLDFDNVGGENDIIFIEQGQGLLFVVLNFTTGGNFPAPPPTIFTIEVKDIFTKSQLLPTSATTFRDKQTGRNILAITAIDTENGGPGTGQLLIAINGATGITGFRQFVATGGATNLLNGDFNNDSLEDLVYIDFVSNLAVVALNNGANSFLDLRFRETGGNVAVSAVAVDVNDDDIPDLMVANQGNGNSLDQSSVSVLIGRGNGEFLSTGGLLQVPNFALSIVGGMGDLGPGETQRFIDFNNDGFPDFAVVSTRGAIKDGKIIPTVTLLLNRPESPGNFNVQSPIPLVDALDNSSSGLQLEGGMGGPGVVSGNFGDPSVTNAGASLGGAYSIMAASDFNLDGVIDLVVTGTRLVNGSNFRSSIYLLGIQNTGTIPTFRSQGRLAYGTDLNMGSDTFIGCLINRPMQNSLPNVVHFSLNGMLWIDSNLTPIVNQAPILVIRRQDLMSPFPGSGRKVIVTAGQSVTVPVSGFDSDGDRLTFRLVATPDGQQPPSFATIRDNGNNSATVNISTKDINRGPGNLTFRIAVEADDGAKGNIGERRPIEARAYFTLVVRPNTPPTVSPIANRTVEVGKTTTVQLSINDQEGQQVTTSVKCDRGNFISVSNLLLAIAPQSQDLGTNTCMLTATDELGLSESAVFIVTVVTTNLPPTISAISDQIVTAGQVRELTVTASDPNGNAGLKLSLMSPPTFVTLIDKGDGTGTVRISPATTDIQSARVVVQVSDSGGLTAQTSFNLNVQGAIKITAASFSKPNLFINGTGFGNSAAKVTVNGKDVTVDIVNQSDSSIVLKGNKKKLNLIKGSNQITVSINGTTSNTFVFNL
jgi:hypothetical protein